VSIPASRSVRSPGTSPACRDRAGRRTHAQVAAVGGIRPCGS
jgi:hypothetical protein